MDDIIDLELEKIEKIQEKIDKAFAGTLKEDKPAIRKPKDPVAGFSKEVLK